MATVRSIASRQNAVVKLFRQAFRQGRSDDGLLAIEGPRMISEALRSRVRVERVLFSAAGEQRHGAAVLPQFSKHTQVAIVADSVFESAVEVEHPQGVAALVKMPQPVLDDAFGSAAVAALVVVAAAVQDPGNLGTLIRSADAFGATGVVTLVNTVSPWNAKAVRASAGSLFHLPIVAQVSNEHLLAACARHETRLLATAARATAGLFDTDLRGRVCLLIGQEGGGVPRELQRAAQGTIAVPMVREVESLNAGVAGAIILYEAARQRRPAAPPGR